MHICMQAYIDYDRDIRGMEEELSQLVEDRTCIMGLTFQEPKTKQCMVIMGQYFQNSNNTRNTLNQPA